MNRPVALGLVLVLAAGLLLVLVLRPGDGPTPGLPTAEISGVFALVDQDGRAVTQDSYRGRWMVVMFGYTRCPDDCGSAPASLDAALGELGDFAKRVQPILVTVDPQHDTPPVLAAYARGFPGGLAALTGTAAQVDATLASFQAQAVRVPRDDGATIEHPDGFYVFAPDGRFVLLFPGGASPRMLADGLAALVAPSS
ncbi:SCO family protein [Zavarzinia sp. CC-PAN008]|uniref:SCO family protein n=1 Tax=Zavarzinia sp. CC-PAN008 TaxID=3243332 RepID=UPI003F7437AA